MNLVKYKNHITLHFIVFLYGFTAILGKLITIDALPIVFYRMFLASLALFFFLKFRKTSFVLPFKSLLKVIGVGFIVGLHWVCFFHAVKISNVSVTLGCMAATTLMTSFIEPLITRRRIFWLEVLIGFIIIIGLYLIFQFETRYTMGIIVALIAAFTAGTFTVFNKSLIAKYNANVISFYEMLAGFFGVGIYMFITQDITYEYLAFNKYDLVWVIILGVICTAYAFAATIEVMKELSAYFVVLSINMEPVYGIILAFFIFGDSEKMTIGFYLGTLIILAAVFAYPFLSNYLKKRKQLLHF